MDPGANPPHQDDDEPLGDGISGASREQRMAWGRVWREEEAARQNVRQARRNHRAARQARLSVMLLGLLEVLLMSSVVSGMQQGMVNSNRENPTTNSRTCFPTSMSRSSFVYLFNND